MIVVSNSSPLITFAKIGHLDLLALLYGSILIPAEVYEEVVVDGRGFPGASSVASLPWLHMRHLADAAGLVKAQSLYRLGRGELASILLGQEVGAELIIVDDLRARRLAHHRGLRVRGCVGVLEAAFRLGKLRDLRQAYAALLEHRAYIDRRILQTSLRSLRLPEL